MRKLSIVLFSFILFTGCNKIEATDSTPVPTTSASTPSPTIPVEIVPNETVSPIEPEETATIKPEETATQTKEPQKTSETITYYVPNIISGQIESIEEIIEINEGENISKVFEQLFKRPLSEDYESIITQNTKINYIETDEQKSLVTIDLSKDFIGELDTGASIENMMLNCIAYTMGNYFNVEYVQITIDGQKYESGHIIREIGDYIEMGDLNK